MGFISSHCRGTSIVNVVGILWQKPESDSEVCVASWRNVYASWIYLSQESTKAYWIESNSFGANYLGTENLSFSTSTLLIYNPQEVKKTLWGSIIW